VPASSQIIEGLHPFYDERVRDLLDFKIYLDISDEVKFAWKIQRDMAERGHSLESIKVRMALSQASRTVTHIHNVFPQSSTPR
jgi:uridine kinase